MRTARGLIFLCKGAVIAALALFMLLPQTVSAQVGGTVLPRYWVEADLDARPEYYVVNARNSIDFYFSPHQAMCESAYGQDWYNICARSTGLTGRTARGFQLIPDHPGEWTWISDNSLRFSPGEIWPAGQNYRVQLDDSALPEGTQLLSALHFSTAPVVAQSEADFKFDPNQLDTAAVSGSLNFNYPMDRDSVIARFRADVVASGPSSLFLTSAPIFSWSVDSRVLYFSVPVHELPVRTGTLRISVKNGALAQSGGTPHAGLELNVSVTGADSIFNLANVSTLTEVGADMAARQLLALEFSLPVTNSQVQQAVEVLLLPRQRVQSDNADSLQPYRWWSLDEITPEILSFAQPLNLVSQNAPDFSALLQNYAFAEELESGRSLLVTLNQNLTSRDGFKLAQGSSFLIQVPSLYSELKIMQNGAVLALTGERTLSLYSRGLDRIAYEVMQIRPELIGVFAGNNYGSFEQPSMWAFDPNQLSEIARGDLPVRLQDGLSAQFSSLDLGRFMTEGRKGLFLLSLSGYKDDQYQSGDTRFVLLTDLALLHKVQSDNTSLVMAVSLDQQQAVQGARIQVLGRNGLPVAEAITDAQGKVEFPDLRGLTPEKEPVAILALNGEDLAFLPWQNSEREINYSRFNIGGNYSQDGLSAFVFSQRGIYRPGETAYFGYILKQSGFSLEGLEGLPLRAEVYDSRGNLFAWDNFNLSSSGFGELDYPIPETAPTGSYTFDLMLGTDSDSALFLASHSFRVEEFQPDTLRLSVLLSPNIERGWLRPADLADGLTVQANLMNLFGAPAIGNNLRATALAEGMSFSFSAWRGWSFYNAAVLPAPDSLELPLSVSDDNGDVAWTIPSDILEGGSRRLTVSVEGFDAAGGRSVRASASVLVSPLEYVVGWRSGSYLAYLRQNSQAQVQFQAIDHTLQGIAVSDLTLETVAVTYVRTLIKDDHGQYRYDNLRQESVLQSRPLSLPQSGLAVDLDLRDAGRYRLVLRDAGGQLVCAVDYTVAGDAVASFGQDREPDLNAVLDKQDYLPGEQVQVYLNAPFAGTGLITIEAEKVESLAWFTTEAGDSVQSISLPSDFEGKAYLNVIFFRNLSDPDIFTKPLAAAALPFTVNMSGRDLNLRLEPLPGVAEKIVRPGSAYPVLVTANRPSQVIVFAVDEGILQLTNFQTPDPLNFLLGDRALQVRTFQYLDLLMPEYGLLHGYLSAFGGGEDLNFAALGQNPFRRRGEEQAVFWSGIIETGPDGVTVDIPVPAHFNGQMRIMAVACADQAVGSARADVLVQAEVVIQPNLPLFVTPGDSFTASVTLTDMSGFAPDYGAEQGRKLTLSALPGPGIELIGAETVEVELFNARQQSVQMQFLATDQLGGTEITFTAQPLAEEPGASVERPLSLSLRPASPLAAQTASGRLLLQTDGTFSRTQALERDLYPQFASLTASVSVLPLPVAHGFIYYLDRYPFGCTEQVVSAAFPFLLLLRYPELTPPGDDFTPEAVRARINAALSTLAQRHDGMGNFADWPGYWSFSTFLNAYVADFLVTAESVGVSIPYNLKYQTMNNLRQMAAQVPGDMVQARDQAYAAWVLTRNGELSTNILATLTAWLNNYQPGWQADLAAVFMAGCWDMMMQPAEAERLLAGFDPNRIDWGGDYFFNNLSSRAFYLSVLAAHFPEKLYSERSEQLLSEIIELAGSQGYMTTSAAQSARALLAYSSSLSAEAADFEIVALDQDGNPIQALPLTGQNGVLLSATLAGSAEGNPILANLDSLRISGNKRAFWQISSSGYDRVSLDQPLFEGLEIQREFRDLNGELLTSIEQGDEVVIALIAKVYGAPRSDIAIVDLLPAGFEMVLTEEGAVVEAATQSGRLRSDRNMSVRYVERREDRLLLFPELDTTESVFRYRVRATGLGRFNLPPVYGDAMYDPAIRAQGAAGWITIN